MKLLSNSVGLLFLADMIWLFCTRASRWLAHAATLVHQLGAAKLEQEREKHDMELNHLSADIEELKKKEREKHDSEFSQLRADIESLKKVRRM